MTFILVTAPAEEPITLDEAKDHLRVSGTDEDALILALIVAAREQVENHTSRPLVAQTWKRVVDRFSCQIDLKPGATSITSIQYQDEDNTQQTLSASIYELQSNGLIPAVGLKYDQEWPDVLSHKNSVEITFVAGYADADSVPTAIKQACLLMIGHLYENRELTTTMRLEQTPMAYTYLLDYYRAPIL